MKKVLIVVLSLVCALCLFACGTSSTDNWQEQYDLGAKYLSEGNYEEAIIAFTAAIEIDDKRAEAYIGRGDAYLALGGTEENIANAQADYQKAQELLQASADSGTSLDESENSVSLNASVYEKLADAWIAQDDWISAVAALQTELDTYGLSENLALKLIELGLALENKGTSICPDYRSAQLEDITRAFEDFEYRHGGIGNADNYYLTAAQREELFRPLLPRFRYYLDYELQAYRSTGNFKNFSYLNCLWYLYYWLGDLEEVRRVRAQLYEVSGLEEYNPDGYTQTIEMESGNDSVYKFNGYGAETNAVVGSLSWTYTYDEHGRLIEDTCSTIQYGDDIISYYYEDGSLVKKTYNSDGVINTTEINEYADGVEYVSIYNEDGTLDERWYWELDKYGFKTMKQAWWIEVE